MIFKHAKQQKSRVDYGKIGSFFDSSTEYCGASVHRRACPKLIDYMPITFTLHNPGTQKNMAERIYDIIIIGAGPGGYVAAVRAAQLGFCVAIADDRESPGGTCLNVGCIPSKALLAASQKLEEAQHHLSDFGIKVGSASLDLPGMMSHKDNVVAANTKGIEYLFNKNTIDWLKGHGTITAPDQVEVAGTPYKAKHIIIATGSAHVDLPGIAVDETRIVSSTGALSLDKVPRKMAVIGAGYIGLELGTVWRRLGAEVTVIEYADTPLPALDSGIAKQMHKILSKQGLDFKLGTKVTEAKKLKHDIKLTLESAKDGETEEIKADAVLVAVGRKPNTDGLGLDTVGVTTNDAGRIEVDDNFRTNVDGIYAIGDVIAGPMLAHKAEDEGALLVEKLAGHGGHIDYNCVPGVVYTEPEVAYVGESEDQLKARGVDYAVGQFPFTANGRARAMGATQGFVKILADKQSDRILGAHIIGPEAGTLISELVLAMEYKASAEDIIETCHAHPTLEEAVKEAAMAVHGRPIHI
jgi:dihydrolipoamide dehydrogenase